MSDKDINRFAQTAVQCAKDRWGRKGWERLSDDMRESAAYAEVTLIANG